MFELIDSLFVLDCFVTLVFSYLIACSVIGDADCVLCVLCFRDLSVLSVVDAVCGLVEVVRCV